MNLLFPHNIPIQSISSLMRAPSGKFKKNKTELSTLMYLILSL